MLAIQVLGQVEKDDDFESRSMKAVAGLAVLLGLAATVALLTTGRDRRGLSDTARSTMTRGSGKLGMCKPTEP